MVTSTVNRVHIEWSGGDDDDYRNVENIDFTDQGDGTVRVFLSVKDHQDYWTMTAFNLEFAKVVELRDLLTGFVDRAASIPCTTCGGEGTIPTKWADDGDAENGPNPYVAEFEYCDCATGVAVKIAEDAESEAWQRGYDEVRRAAGMSQEDMDAEDNR